MTPLVLQVSSYSRRDGDDDGEGDDVHAGERDAVWEASLDTALLSLLVGR
jgi:hypothetical protein